VRPAQFAGPVENGMNASRVVMYSTIVPVVELGSQRSGMNSSGEGEK